MSHVLDKLPSKVLPNNLIVKVIDKNEDKEQVTESGIILSVNNDQKNKGRLVEVKVVRVPPYQRLPDRVVGLDRNLYEGAKCYVYHPSLTEEFSVGDQNYYFCRIEDVLLVEED